MLRNLGDIISGKRWKENKINSFASTEPTARLKESEFAADPVTMHFGSALAMTTWGVVINLVLEPEKPPPLTALAKSLDATPLRRLSAFVAWWATNSYQADAREIIKNEDDDAERFEQWMQTTSGVLSTMFPGDDVSRNAIAAYVSREKKIEDGGFATSCWDAVRIAIGVPPSDISLDDFPYHLAVSATLIGYRDMLANAFGIFQGGNSGDA